MFLYVKSNVKNSALISACHSEKENEKNVVIRRCNVILTLKGKCWDNIGMKRKCSISFKTAENTNNNDMGPVTSISRIYLISVKYFQNSLKN